MNREYVQITWSAANNVSVSAAGNETSDVVEFDDAAVEAMLCLKVDNPTTDEANDADVDFYILYTSGDPDGSDADEYDTEEHAKHLANLNTDPTETPGENPARTHVQISTAAKGFKLYVVNNGATDDIIVSAKMTEKRA